jgi:hypothetical protein
MEKNQSRFITMALAVLIIVSAFIYIYVTFLDNQPTLSIGDDSPILTLWYDESPWNVTLDELENLESFTGTGRFIKTKLLPDSVVLGDEYEYTGVRMTTLLNEIPTLPSNYTITVTALDDYSIEYIINEINGIVDVYSENGSILSNETAIMVMVYKEDGMYYSEIDPDSEEIGPYRIAFVGEDQPITPSGLWTKRVISIEIHAQQ